MNQVVLDLDLDFFVSPIKLYAADRDPRLPEGEYVADSKDAVRDFLETKLKLSRDRPVAGKVVTHHVEVFHIWESMIASGLLTPKFSVLHVDAHDDADGIGFAVNSGNFITHAISKGWLQSVAFVQHRETQNLPQCYVKFSPARFSVKGQEARISIALKGETLSEFPDPDFLFLACSPAFTPRSADALIPVIREYIKDI